MRTPSRAVCKIWLLTLSVLCALGCSGPRDATPLPEPPALSPDRIGIPKVMMVASTGIPLEGLAGAAPPNALVRVTNLDSSAAPVSVNAAANGAFTLTVPGLGPIHQNVGEPGWLPTPEQQGAGASSA